MSTQYAAADMIFGLKTVWHKQINALVVSSDGERRRVYGTLLGWDKNFLEIETSDGVLLVNISFVETIIEDSEATS